MVDYTHPLDENFHAASMNDPSGVNHWFGGKTPAEARKQDLDYIVSKGLDINKTFTQIADSMDFFVDIVADLVIEQFESGKKLYENDIYRVEAIADSKGIQVCPWHDNYWSSGTETIVTNKKTGVQLQMNYGTAHMARVHQILEKGADNPYAISVKLYLENFVNFPDYAFSAVRYSQR